MMQETPVATGLCCLTVWRLAQLPQARILAATLKRLHPAWHLVAALADAPPPGLAFTLSDDGFDEVLPAPTPQAAGATTQAASSRDAAHAAALQHLVEAGHDRIVVLAPGVAVLNPLTPLVDLLALHPIVLVPHQLVASEGSAQDDILTPGCVAFRASAEGARFATEWGRHLRHGQAQHWLDRVPVLFDGVHILKDPGWQVSRRNLAERTLAFDSAGRLLANDHLLRTFDGSDRVADAGPVPVDPLRFSVAAHDLLCWYRLEVARFDDPALPREDARPESPAPAAALAGPMPAPPGRPASSPAAQGTTPTRYGVMRCFLDDDLISRFLRVYGEWAHFETQLLASLRCARVFDIGAYLGTFSLGVAVSEPDFVLAVEANPEAHALLRANLARNLPAPYATLNAAVLQDSGAVTGAPSAVDNRGTFTVHAPSPGAPGPVIPVRTLAELRAEFGPYDLLKLDVEGSEREVIHSDAEWIVANKPVIWAECNEHPDSLALFSLLQALGYDLWFYRFPAFNPDNFLASGQRLVPLGHEAGLLAVAPGGPPPTCPPEAARAGAELVRVDGVESLRQALWRTPRQGDARWEFLSRTELLGLLSRQPDEARGYDAFLSGREAPAPATGERVTGRDVGASYRNDVAAILQAYGEQEGMSMAVGGQFEAIGQIECALLFQQGLHDQASIIDVGCGSGRLASQLKDRFAGRYVGIDVVPALLAYAERICNRPDWRFYQAPGFAIPEPDDSADFICFFSVFTHLLHEESYTYLQDAKRVCKPGGRILFSFLEFRIPSQWPMFELAVADTRPDKVLNQFMSRDAIEAWAGHLGLEILAIHDGDKPHIDLLPPGSAASGEGATRVSLGQSVCVLTKRAPA